MRSVVERFGLRSKKALGQHFLLDEAVTERIARLAGDLSGVHVIEIGPGPGGLTRALLCSEAAGLSVIEKDARALPALELLRPHSGGRLHIYEADALQLRLPALTPAPRAIVANLPYNIGTELLLGWLEDIARDPPCYRSLTLMFQQEVGERLAAAPGCKAYGRLSVLTQWLCEVQPLMPLPPEAFSPPPKVASIVMQLIPREVPLYPADKTALETVLRTAFAQRRKMLRTALKPLPLTQTPAQLGLDETLRPDQLSPAQFCLLANALAPSGPSAAK